MEKGVDLLEKSQRLRYEAFSVFAAQINKAGDIETIGLHLASQLKFILDGFILHVFHLFQGEHLCLQVYRGTCRSIENSQDHFTSFATQLLQKSIPVYLTKEEVLAEPQLLETLFNHEKTRSFYALPTSIHAHHQLVIAIANKEDSHYTEVDFRFIRLISDLLASKLSQLTLLKNIESKNKQLGEANASLADANEELLTLNEKIGQLNLSLEKKVEARTFELKHANEELQTIFYRTSHDFRRPLTSILGLMQVGEMTTQEQEILELFSRCKSVVGELDAMLSKLSILSTQESSALKLELIDFEHVCEEIYAKFKDTLEQKAIQYTYTIFLKHTFYSDKALLVAILENLVENAIHFHGPNPCIKLQISEQAEKLFICIKDNGQGIAEHVVDKIFDMYYRANDQSKGNGLGLYVVKKLVKVLEGEILVESKIGKGSTFTILLPYLR